MEKYELTGEDLDLVWYFAGAAPCSLERKPGDSDNWVERAGGLPKYICEIARAIHREGKPISSSIAIAVSRAKKWAAGLGGVDADTKAKAAKAVAQWTALKARSAAKKLVKATNDAGEEYIILSEVSNYSLDQVRVAWNKYSNELNKAVAEAFDYKTADIEAPYSYVREVYVDYIIVSYEGREAKFAKINYTVTGNNIVFGVPEPIQMVWTDNKGWATAAAPNM